MTPLRLSDFLPLAVLSLRHPRVALRRILEMPTTLNEIILAGCLIIVLNLLFGTVFSMFDPVSESAGKTYQTITIEFAVMALSMFGGAVLVHRIGRWFGGYGAFDDSLKTIVWLHFIMLLVQLPIPVIGIYFVEMVGFVLLLGVIFAMVQFTAQIMELHGFTKVMPVLFGIIGTQFILAIVFVFIFTLVAATFGSTDGLVN